MTTQTIISADEPTIIMTRTYAAPRSRVWEAMTRPEHVKQWWGGPGFSNPVCEMDVQPGGLWNHVMRFPNGFELRMHFVFLEVDPPSRLVWQHANHGKPTDTRTDGPPTCKTTVTLTETNGQAHWHMVAHFASMEARDAAVAMGFSGPIEASSDRLVAYLAQW